MRRKATRRLSGLLLCTSVFAIGLVLLGTAQPAQATFALGFDLDLLVFPVDLVIPDNSAADLDPTVGIIAAVSSSPAFIGVFGAGALAPFTSVSVTVSKPTLPPPPQLDLNAVVIGGPGSLMVLASDQGFSQPAGPVTLLSELGGTTQGTVSAVQGIDTLDELFGLFFFDVFVIPIFQGPLGPGPFADTAAAPFGGDPSFSITDAVTVTHTGAGQITSFNILSSVVPEPASLLLLGSGLVGLALYGRRRLK